MRIDPFSAVQSRALCELWFDSFESAGLAHGPDTTVESLIGRLSEEIAGGWNVFVAAEDTAMLGFLAFDPQRNYLHQLFIARAAQGRGVGKALLDFAKERMPAGFRLRTQADNIGAQKFYAREGLARVTTEQHPRYGHLTHVYKWL
jgi:GNAT superfamily N-acetyltransferase